jgi:hypothetical protein
VSELVTLPGRAKFIGMHVPPIGPHGDWSEEDLARFKTYAKPLEARGPLTYRFEPAGGKALKGHPLFAIRPPGGPFGMDAEHGSFRSARETFIRELAKPAANVQLVFTGHIHRNDLLAVRVPTQPDEPKLKGQYLVKSVSRMPSGEPGRVHAPQILPRVVVDPRRLDGRRAPLSVNTTSTGPLGNYRAAEQIPQFTAPGYTHVELSAAGVVEQVSFRFPVKPVPLVQAAPVAVAVGRR